MKGVVHRLSFTFCLAIRSGESRVEDDHDGEDGLPHSQARAIGEVNTRIAELLDKL